MKNVESWRPTKYRYDTGRIKADPGGVGPGSLLTAGLIGMAFQEALDQAHGRLVDLGCGDVPLYAAYRDRVSDVTCVDWTGSVSDRSHVDIEGDLGEPLPFDDGQFDTVILSDVLEHLPRPAVLWGEMYRILAPGGKALISVPFMYWVHTAPYDFHRYTEFGLRHYADEAGFDVEGLRPLGGSIEVLVDVSSKMLQVIPIVGPTTARILQRVALTFSRTPIGRRLIAITGKKMPLGYLMVVARPE